MSTQAAEVNSSNPMASEDPTGAIADLLIGDEEANKDEEEEGKEASTEAAAEEDKEGVEETTDESTEEVAADDDEDISWESVLGVDEGQLNFDEDGNLVGVNTKIDGESSTVGMKDLISGYQSNKATTQKSQALSEERKTFDGQKQEFEQQFTQKLQEVTVLGDYLEKQLIADFEGVDWERLRVEDAAEYAALRQDYATRAQDMQQFKAAMQTETDKQKAANDEQLQASNATRMREQYGKMIENNPAWANKDEFEKDMNGLKSFCSEQYGFSDDDFKLVQDARLIELIKDANSYRKGMASVSEKLKKPVPKFQKSVGKASKKVSKLERLTKTAKSAKGANKRTAQADAVTELLIGG